MVEKNKKPEIRFKGFTDDWEVRKLNEIADVIGGGTPSTSVLEYWDGDIDWYSPTEIGKEIYAIGSVKKITLLGLKKSSARMLPPNKTVLFTSRAGIGYMAILKRDGATNQGFQSLVVKDGINPYFIYSIGHLIKEYALKHASGSTFLEISGKVLGNMDINIPLTSEQSKIGTYFNNLDHLITLNQRKYDKLVTVKKAMLEKMFPKKGADVPEIRFKGFTEAWEQWKIKEIASDISDGDWIEANHIFEEGKYRIIQTGNLGLGEYFDKANNAKYFHQKDFDEIKANEIFPGDILISRLAEPAGRTIVLPKTGFRMVTAVDVTIIRPDDNSFDTTFLMTQLNCKNVLQTINENVSGTSHRRISRKNLENTKLTVPILDEQKKIGTFFKHLDHLLILQQRELEKLKNIKKACLEKMFV